MCVILVGFFNSKDLFLRRRGTREALLSPCLMGVMAPSSRRALCLSFSFHPGPPSTFPHRPPSASVPLAPLSTCTRPLGATGSQPLFETISLNSVTLQNLNISRVWQRDPCACNGAYSVHVMKNHTLHAMMIHIEVPESIGWIQALQWVFIWA